jgi:hypothetical protein
MFADRYGIQGRRVRKYDNEIEVQNFSSSPGKNITSRRLEQSTLVWKNESVFTESNSIRGVFFSAGMGRGALSTQEGGAAAEPRGYKQTVHHRDVGRRRTQARRGR